MFHKKSIWTWSSKMNPKLLIKAKTKRTNLKVPHTKSATKLRHKINIPAMVQYHASSQLKHSHQPRMVSLWVAVHLAVQVLLKEKHVLDIPRQTLSRNLWALSRQLVQVTSSAVSTWVNMTTKKENGIIISTTSLEKSTDSLTLAISSSRGRSLNIARISAKALIANSVTKESYYP